MHPESYAFTLTHAYYAFTLKISTLKISIFFTN